MIFERETEQSSLIQTGWQSSIVNEEITMNMKLFLEYNSGDSAGFTFPERNASTVIVALACSPIEFPNIWTLTELLTL